jgi:hypothetical protein
LGAADLRGSISDANTAPLTVGAGGPVVQFAVASAMVDEGGAINVVLQLSPPQPVPVRVPLTLLGSAANGVDYGVAQGAVASPVEVHFEAEQATATLSVQALADAADDPGETVVLSLGAPDAPGVAVGANNTTVLTITQPGTPGDLLFRNGFEPALRPGD